MARPRKTLHPEDLKFRGAGWSKSLSRGVGNRLRRKILDIARTLGLDHEVEVSDHSGGLQYNLVPRLLENWGAIHEEHMRGQKTYKRDQQGLTAVAVSVPYVLRLEVHDIRRKLALGPEVSDEQIHRACDLAEELRDLENDLVAILLKAYAAVRDSNRVPNSVRRTLKDLQRVPDDELPRAVDMVDGNTRGRIVDAWQKAEGNGSVQPGDTEAWRQAIELASQGLPRPERKRQTGSINRANRVLGRDLGELFYRRTGRPPRRNWNEYKVKEQESGRFYEFVGSVHRIVPDAFLPILHRRGTTRHQGVAEIVSRGSELWKGHTLENPPPDVFPIIPHNQFRL